MLHPTIVERLACDLITLNAEGGEQMTRRLIEKGYTGSELATYGDAARTLANSMFVKAVAEDEPAYDRAERIREAVIIGETVIADEPALVLALRHADFAAREIGDLWPDIVAGIRQRRAWLTGEVA